MSALDFLPLQQKESHLKLDDLTPEDIDKKFDRLIRENDLKEQLDAASNPQEIIDNAYKNLNLVIDVHKNFSPMLAEDKRDELKELIENDAYTLIAGRISKDEYGLTNITSQFEKAAELPVDSRMRDLLALANSLDILKGNEAIETGIRSIARGLPSHNTQSLLQALDLVKKDSATSFMDEYASLQGKKRLGFIATIEHVGQRLTLNPDEIKQAERRGDLIDPSRKERNFIRKTGTSTTIMGDLALKLSKRFRS
jgi:hypothetical protein